MWLPFLLAQPALIAFDVQVESCSLDAAELSRLTTLELRSADAPPLRVSYRCAGGDVTIGLENTETGIRVERVAAKACCDDVETERTLALLATGLFKAAGGALGKQAATPSVEAPSVETPSVERPIADEPPSPSPATAPPPATLVAPPAPLPVSPPPPTSTWRPVVAAPPADRLEPPTDHTHVIGLSGQVRAWNTGAPILGYGVGLHYRGWVWPTVGFGGHVSALFGSSDRVGGQVMSRVISTGATFEWRFARWRPIALSAEVTGGVSVVSLEGQAATTGFAAESVTGATGNLGISFVPTVLVDRTQLALPLGAGALFRAPRGFVTSDTASDTVQLDGLWLGGALRVSLGFAPRRSTPAVARGRR